MANRNNERDEDGRSSPRGDATVSDRAPLETGTGTSRQRAEINTTDDPELESARAAAALDEAAMGHKEPSDSEGDGGYEETEDGLSELEEATREQAEDRATGDRKGFRP